jgi:hypothetical protein
MMVIHVLNPNTELVSTNEVPRLTWDLIDTVQHLLVKLAVRSEDSRTTKEKVLHRLEFAQKIRDLVRHVEPD